MVYEDVWGHMGTFGYFFRSRAEAERELAAQGKQPHNFSSSRMVEIVDDARVPPILLRARAPEANAPLDLSVDALTRLVASAKVAFLQGVNTARFGPPCDCCDLDPDQLIAADGTRLDKDLTEIEKYARASRREALLDAARAALGEDTVGRAVKAILAMVTDSDDERRALFEQLVQEDEAEHDAWEKKHGFR